MIRSDVEALIHSNFGGIVQDYPWEDSPEYTIFRHADNKKWFALIAKVKYQALNIDKAGSTDIINLKSDPDLIEELIKTPAILPAYHMNKRHWITIRLDQFENLDLLGSLIDKSYGLTSKKRRRSLD